MHSLVLASGSPYRRQLLDKLGLTYEWRAAKINEQAQEHELPEALALRLARQKASKLASHFPSHLIIGSDQVAVLDGEILGKPGDFKTAQRQLTAMSGKTLHFFTGLCLLNSASKQKQLCCETYSVSFRSLSQTEIANYLMREQPFDCAGSFKAEGLGISLFEKMTGDDPNTLIGLPLIALITLLKAEGVEILR